MEKKNAKELPKKFYARHMNNGLAGYQDETILVSTETMKAMCKSFEMKPVYIGHQNVNIENLENEAAGYVTRCFYNESDGWLWAEMIIIGDEAHEQIAKGYQVSNAYIPTEWGGGGTCHDIAYDREILNGDFTHLAIVPNPRYEDAVIMSPDEFKNYQDKKTTELNELKNSKTKKRDSKMKFWIKKEADNSDELLNASVTLLNGKDVTIKDMIETLENAKKNEYDKDDKKEKVNMDAEVSVGDKTMTLKELVSSYQEMNKKNESDDDKKDKENECKDGEDKKNADDAEDKKDEDKSDKENKNSKDDEVKKNEKENAKFFDELTNASAFGKIEKSKPDLRIDAIKRGKERY